LFLKSSLLVIKCYSNKLKKCTFQRMNVEFV
jgi:hypothetical protein